MTPYSVIVVNRDNPRALFSTLLALRAHAQPDEVLLVDPCPNNDLTGIATLSRVPARVLRSPQVPTLGAAFNAGIDAATHDIILLLLGDVALDSDPAEAVPGLVTRPELGISAGQIVAADAGSGLVLGGYWTGRGRVTPEVIGRGEPPEAGAIAPDAVHAACTILRRTDLRFDERYWFGLEDIDLSFQYRQRGWGVQVSRVLLARQIENRRIRERWADVGGAARRVASRLLYHERWCSDLPLEQHPLQSAARGDAASDYLRRAEQLVGTPYHATP